MHKRVKNKISKTLSKEVAIPGGVGKLSMLREKRNKCLSSDKIPDHSPFRVLSFEEVITLKKNVQGVRGMNESEKRIRWG